eukprot:1150379-Pelagomonas_calceolata.AAC.2
MPVGSPSAGGGGAYTALLKSRLGRMEPSAPSTKNCANMEEGSDLMLSRAVPPTELLQAKIGQRASKSLSAHSQLPQCPLSLLTALLTALCEPLNSPHISYIREPPNSPLASQSILCFTASCISSFAA